MAKRGYRVVLRHKGLNKCRVVTGRTLREVNQKIDMQNATWNEQWARKQAQEANRRAQEAKRAEQAKQARDVDRSKSLAELRTRNAELTQAKLDTILTDTLDAAEVSFDDQYDRSVFDVPKPVESTRGRIPLPVEPRFENEEYHPKMPLLVSLSSKKSEEFEAQNRAKYEADHRSWELRVRDIESRNAIAHQQFEASVNDWERERTEFSERVAEANAEIDAWEEGFRAGDREAVRSFYSLAIESIDYPVQFPHEVYCDYDSDSRTLIIDHYLPSQDDLPTLKAVTYVKTRNELKERHQTAAYMKKRAIAF